MTSKEAEIIKLMLVVRLKMEIYELQGILTNHRISRLENIVKRLQHICFVLLFVVTFLLIKMYILPK